MKFLISFFLVLSLSAADWYVSKVATGANNGTSWANAWTNLASAAGASSGDTVYFSGGTVSETYNDWYLPVETGVTYRIGQDAGHNGYFIFDGGTTNLSFMYQTGTTISNVVVDFTYNGERRLIITNMAAGSTIQLDNQAFYTLKGFIVQGQFRFNPATNIVIQNCYVEPPDGISSCILFNVVGAVGGSYTNNEISNCDIVMHTSPVHPAWGADGIKSFQYGQVFSNRFRCIPGALDTEWEHSDGMQALVGSGGNTDGSWVKIHGNTFENIANYSIYWEMFGNATNVNIYNNVFKYTSSYYATNLSTAIVVAVQNRNGNTYDGLHIDYNTIVDFYGRSAFGFGGLANTNTYTNCTAIGNLIVNSGNGSSDAGVFGDGLNGTNGFTVAYNKVIAGASGSTVITPAQMVDSQAGTTIPFITYSPLGANNFDLSASLYTGPSLAASFTTDFDGVIRTVWNAGAYEYGGSPPGAGSASHFNKGKTLIKGKVVIK